MFRTDIPLYALQDSKRLIGIHVDSSAIASCAIDGMVAKCFAIA